MKIKLLSISLVFVFSTSFSQVSDEKIIREIYSQALTNSKCYSWLDYLSNKIGHRLSGSVGAEKAVLYTKAELEQLGLDRVFLQEVMVPKWVRGQKETAYFVNGSKKIPIAICALGGSIATPKTGISAKVIEVKSIAELIKLGSEKVSGKIVFFNRPMNPEDIETFHAYGGCVDQRFAGPEEAAKFGAIGTIVRSMNLRLDDFPHTGVMSYGNLPKEKHIPAAAISTNAAELLSMSLKTNPNLKFYFKQSCQSFDDVLSYNVVGEIKGTVTPDKIMIVGGHLDSWDLADGSHDDGAGVVQSLEVLHLLKSIGYKPKNTIRAVLFMNEENGTRGAKKYEELSVMNNENHVFAMESDSGGFTPRGFTLDCADDDFKKIVAFTDLFKPYLIHSFEKGHGGADIGPLSSKKIIKVGLHPDSQRYFDYHHASNDTFDAVNKRELELGAAAMTSLIYLLDSKGL
ncbi:MAG: hypothetical protein RLZZ312_1261 [Bacteroidota bacterium]